MPRVGFEPTIPASKRAKTVCTLDGSATVAGQDLVAYFDFPWNHSEDEH
jgi:hypothetical protein